MNNRQNKNGIHPSRQSSAAHKSNEFGKRKESGAYILNYEKNFYERGPINNCLPDPKLEDYKLTYNMY
jgi:hypothetical protein